MNARALACSLALVTSGLAVADPSGNKWFFPACTNNTCPNVHDANMAPLPNKQCVNNVCVPNFTVATSVDNGGGMTIKGGVSYAGMATRVQSAFAAWTAQRVGCNTTWNSVYGGTFTDPGVAAIDRLDRKNRVMWMTAAQWPHMTELALTTTTYFTTSHEIFDGDMEINNDLNGAPEVWSTTGAPGSYDIDSVLIHEAGHFLGLNHTNGVSTAVMYPFVPTGSTKRVLTPTDENDVCAVYPGGTGGQGTTCTTSSQCSGGRVCEAVSGGSSKICTQDCASAGAAGCPTGYTCQASTAGFACLPQIGTPDQCRFCQLGSECSSGLCLRFDTGVTFCSLTCTDNAQCGPNYTCQMPDGFCVPNANTCTNQCTSATDCATGYTCTGGTCTPRGDPGDPCTVSLVCKSCGVCTRESATTATSYCRSCCATTGAGFCAGCPNTACGAGNTCAQLTTGNSSVCLPGASAPGTCQACNNGQCAEGLLCVAGRCRSPCNPASPGTCQACTSSGACACPDEIAGVGESCGVVNNTLSACGPGLACVGASPVCRTRCDGTAGSCPTGQVCQLMNGLNVCVPGAEGNKCAPTTNTGACNPGLTAYLGRCYEPCNVNLGTACSSCVQSSANGAGVCGCPDQISAANEPCGTQPDVRACQTGAKCINGSCRTPCDLQLGPTCPDLTECREYTVGQFYCQDQIATGGSGGGSSGGGSGRTGGSGGSSATGGSGGGGTTDLGCGCGASGGPLGALVFGLLMLARRRQG